MHYSSADPDDDFTKTTVISSLRPMAHAGDNAANLVKKRNAVLAALQELNEKQLQYVLDHLSEL